jgi:hypothetical protein
VDLPNADTLMIVSTAIAYGGNMVVAFQAEQTLIVGHLHGSRRLRLLRRRVS